MAELTENYSVEIDNILERLNKMIPSFNTDSEELYLLKELKNCCECIKGYITSGSGSSQVPEEVMQGISDKFDELESHNIMTADSMQHTSMLINSLRNDYNMLKQTTDIDREMLAGAIRNASESKKISDFLMEVVIPNLHPDYVFPDINAPR